MKILFLLIFPFLTYTTYASLSSAQLNGQCERVGFGSAQQAFFAFFEKRHKSRRAKKQFQEVVTDLFAEGKDEKEVLKSLIRKGHINSPLLSALAFRSPSKALRLIQEQPDQLNGPFGTAGFFMMVTMGYREMVLLALQHQPDLAHLKTGENDQPLSYSTDPEITEALIVYGASVNSWNKKGRTALYHADNKEVAEVLIHYGADLTAKDYSGLSPLEYHKKFVGDNKIISLLEAKQQESREQRMQEQNQSFRALKRRKKTKEEEQEREQQLAKKRAELLKQSEYAQRRKQQEQEERTRRRKEKAELRAQKKERERIENQLVAVRENKSKLSEQIIQLDLQVAVLKNPVVKDADYLTTWFGSSNQVREWARNMARTEFMNAMEKMMEDTVTELKDHKTDLQNRMNDLKNREQELSLALEESQTL